LLKLYIQQLTYNLQDGAHKTTRNKARSKRTESVLPPKRKSRPNYLPGDCYYCNCSSIDLKMKWISVKDKLPEPGVKVNLSYGLFGIRAAVCDEWISTGWLTKSGFWSIKHTTNVHILSKPTHWAPIE